MKMSTEKEYIEIYGAREHNLKNINVKIPRNELVTITGLSGSGNLLSLLILFLQKDKDVISKHFRRMLVSF
jgi:excinuclease UvrABC ATPase subunit